MLLKLTKNTTCKQQPRQSFLFFQYFTAMAKWVSWDAAHQDNTGSNPDPYYKPYINLFVWSLALEGMQNHWFQGQAVENTW